MAEILPDSLDHHLEVIFVGTAPGHRSAREGVYYANPGNQFWTTLKGLELVAQDFRPDQFRMLLEQGIGFTDMCKTQEGSDSEITDYDRRALERSLERYRPRTVAFTSKKAASVWFDCTTKELSYGMQRPDDCEPVFFVLPSPSGAARSHWTIEPWHDLAKFLRKPRRPRPWRIGRSPG
jgi:double-stranded uracil-DNA glycosylase